MNALLARAGCTEEDLENGPERGSRCNHNCSGKHAGMLLLAKLRGWPQTGYRLPDHPLQIELRAILAGALGVDDPPMAVDGCGVPTYAAPL